jgi:peptidoglycan/xylan/chitin deacetylase (PgdA/CDA1 family)
MAHLKRWYDVISLDQLVATIKAGKCFSVPTVILTIDDGFKDNYDLAYPILKRLGLPATIFLTSGLVNTPTVPWVDEIGIALAKTKLGNLYFPQLFGDQVVAISNNEQKAETLHRIYEKLLYLEHNTKVDLVDTLLSILSDKDDLLPHERIMLNWKEIKQMTQNNISFGAHTMTHPTLSKMDSKDAMREIIESKLIIEKKLGIRVRHFAIPNGQDEDFTEELRDFCRKAIFDSVVTTNYGVVKKESDLYNLPRVHPSTPLFVFATDLARLFLINR